MDDVDVLDVLIRPVPPSEVSLDPKPHRVTGGLVQARLATGRHSLSQIEFNPADLRLPCASFITSVTGVAVHYKQEPTSGEVTSYYCCG